MIQISWCEWLFCLYFSTIAEKACRISCNYFIFAKINIHKILQNFLTGILQSYILHSVFLPCLSNLFNWILKLTGQLVSKQLLLVDSVSRFIIASQDWKKRLKSLLKSLFHFHQTCFPSVISEVFSIDFFLQMLKPLITFSLKPDDKGFHISILNGFIFAETW